VETIPIGYNRTFQSLDRPQKLEILPRTSQVKWTTSLVVFKVTRLQLYIETYTGKDEYEGRYSFKKRTSEHKGRQQRCLTPEGRIMATKDNSRDYNDKKEDKSRRRQYTQRN